MSIATKDGKRNLGPRPREKKERKQLNQSEYHDDVSNDHHHVKPKPRQQNRDTSKKSQKSKENKRRSKKSSEGEELASSEMSQNSDAQKFQYITTTRKENEDFNDQECYINKLPDAIFVKIFQKLSLSDVVCNISLVSKQWHRLRDSPDLWRCIELSHSVRITKKVISRLTGLSENVSRLDLMNLPRLMNGGFINACRNCRNLRELSVSSCSKLTRRSFQAIAASCQQITKLHLHSCDVTSKTLTQIAEKCNLLEEVSIYDLRGEIHDGMKDLFEKLPGLKALGLGKCGEMADDFLTKLAENCVKLEHLRLMGKSFSQTRLGNLQLLTKLSRVQFIEISALTSQCVLNIVKANPDLRILQTYGCPQVSPTTYTCVAAINRATKCLFKQDDEYTDEDIDNMFVEHRRRWRVCR